MLMEECSINAHMHVHKYSFTVMHIGDEIFLSPEN